MYEFQSDSDENSKKLNPIQLENGQVVQATQIGPSIPISGPIGQPFQMMLAETSSNGHIQIVPVSNNN